MVGMDTTPADRATQLIELQQQYDQEHTARLTAEKASFSVRRPATDTIDSLAVQMPSVAERVAEQQNVRRGSVASVDSAYDTTGLALFETGSLASELEPAGGDANEDVESGGGGGTAAP